MTERNGRLLALVAAATAALLVLGFVGLGDQSLWLDEEMSLNIATAGREQMALWFTSHPEQHPLYYLLLRGWTAVFGTSEVALRSMSLLFAAVAVPLLYVLGRDLLGRREGAAAALLLALSPFWFFYAREGRMYTLLVALGILASILALVEARATGDRPDGGAGLPWLYWLTATLGMYTHFFFGFLVLAHAAAVLLRSGDLRRNASRALLLGLPVLVAYGPWLAFTVAHMPEGQDWKGLRHVVFGIPYTLVRFAIGYAELPIQYRWQDRLGELLLASAPLLVAAVVAHAVLFCRGTVEAAHRGRVERTFLTSCLVLPVALPLLLSPWMILSGERYFMLVLPFYLLVLGAGFVCLVEPGPGRVIRAIAPALFVLVTARCLWAYRSNPEFGKEQWREVVSTIEAEAVPGPVLVIVAPDMSEGVLDYYLDQTPRLRLEPWRPGEPVRVADARRIWVVVTRLLDPSQVTGSLPVGWEEVERRLFPKDTGIWLIAFDRVAPDP
jgi:uncharacterized membrane protein